MHERRDQLKPTSDVLPKRVVRKLHREGGLELNTADRVPKRSHVARVQHLARERAEAQARRVPWQRLLHTRKEYIDWQEFYLWVRSVLEIEHRIPDWLVEILDERCPGFVENERERRGAFARVPLLVGKTVILNHLPYTVIGIAAPRFSGVDVIPTTFWASLAMQRALDRPRSRRRSVGDDNLSWLAMLGRVQADMPLTHVRADLNVNAGRIDQRHPRRTTSLAISKATLLSDRETSC